LHGLAIAHSSHERLRWPAYFCYLRATLGKEPAIDNNQRVGDMAVEVLARQAEARAEQTGEPFERALKAVLGTRAGAQLEELRDGAHRDESANQWQEDCAQERAIERKRIRKEELNRVRQEAAWERFIHEEQRELELRKDGQLAELLGAPLLGESPTALQRLASEDQRQAEEGLVALMTNGKMSYKRLDQLSEGDVPGRIAARRLRTTWLKKRGDGWLGRRDDYQ
jgi:hypothetical protein